MSQEGSLRAVRAVLASAALYAHDGGRVADLDEATLADWFRVAAWQIQEEADSEGRPVRDYACTLLCAVIDREAAAYAQLGDGAIVAGCGEDIEPVFWPQQGEYANTTYFITAPEHLERVQMRTGAEVPERVALLSDGLQNLALRMVDRSAYPGFFSPLFRDLLRQPPGEAEALLEPLRDFLNSPRVNARTDDDKSLLLAVREMSTGGREPNDPEALDCGGGTSAARGATEPASTDAEASEATA
jgi:hypothetical protein